MMSSTKSESVSAGTLYQQVLTALKAPAPEFPGLTGTPSGFVGLDKLTCGWQAGDLIALGGRPGMGKSSFLLSMMLDVTANYGHPILYFSLEQDLIRQMLRLVSFQCNMSTNELAVKVNREAIVKKVEKANILSSIPLTMLDAKGWSIDKIIDTLSKQLKKTNTKLVVIDGLRFITSKKMKTANPIGQITKRLKEVSRQLNVPIIVSSQISRELEERGGLRRPELGDLMDYELMEPYLDVVVHLYRPDYYGLAEDEQGNQLSGICEGIVVKNRFGLMGSFFMRFKEINAHFQDCSFEQSMKLKSEFDDLLDSSMSFDEPF